MNAGAKRLGAWIARKKLTHEGAARRIGVLRVQVTVWLSGRRRPGLRNALRIERVAKIPAGDWNRDT